MNEMNLFLNKEYFSFLFFTLNIFVNFRLFSYDKCAPYGKKYFNLGKLNGKNIPVFLPVKFHKISCLGQFLIFLFCLG